MWISRAQFIDLVQRAAQAERIDDLKTQVADGKDIRSQLVTVTEQYAALRSTFQWLTEHVNRLERERAELMQRVLQTTFPAMEIARAAELDRVTESAARIVGKPVEEEPSIADMQVSGSIFEDVGDAMAAKLGVQHDEMGNVKWTR